MKKSSKEYILCAAIHYMDGIQRDFQPINIVSGIVVTGYSHSCCIFNASLMNIVAGMSRSSGFLTSSNRFVGREEAMRVAIDAGQVSKNRSDTSLTSEDLYNR